MSMPDPPTLNMEKIQELKCLLSSGKRKERVRSNGE